MGKSTIGWKDSEINAGLLAPTPDCSRHYIVVYLVEVICIAEFIYISAGQLRVRPDSDADLRYSDASWRQQKKFLHDLHALSAEFNRLPVCAVRRLPGWPVNSYSFPPSSIVLDFGWERNVCLGLARRSCLALTFEVCRLWDRAICYYLRRIEVMIKPLSVCLSVSVFARLPKKVVNGHSFAPDLVVTQILSIRVCCCPPDCFHERCGLYGMFIVVSTDVFGHRHSLNTVSRWREEWYSGTLGWRRRRRRRRIGLDVLCLSVFF